MPPKLAARPRTRLASRELEQEAASRNHLTNFLKPNLPPLQGTPSSRRQYSYGAAAEPLPTQPGHELQRGQVLNLSNAVRSALLRHDQEHHLHATNAIESPTKSLDTDPEEDELAQSSTLATRRHGAARPPFDGSPEQQQLAEESEPDNSRSFGMESDYYGDATIGSTTEDLGLPPVTNYQQSALASEKRQLTPADQNQSGSVQSPGDEGPSAYAAAKTKTTAQPVHSRTARTSQFASDHLQEDELTSSQDGHMVQSAEANPSDPEATGDLPNRRPPTRRGPGISTPASRRTRASARIRSLAGQSQAATSNRGNLSTAQPTRDSAQLHLQAEFGPAGMRPGKNLSAENRHSRPAKPQAPANDESFDDDGSSVSGRWIAGTRQPMAYSPVSPEKTPPHAQETLPAKSRRKIRSGETRCQLLEDGAAPSRNQQTWAWFTPPRLRQLLGCVNEDSGAPHASAASSWWRNAIPQSRLGALASSVKRFWECILDLFISTLSFLTQERVLLTFQAFSYIFGGIVFSVVLVVLSNAAINNLKSGATDDLWAPISEGASWPHMGDLTKKLTNFVPTPWSNREDDVSELWDEGDFENSDIGSLLKKVKTAVRRLQKADQLHEGALQRLEAIVPKLVFVPFKDGKITVAPEFWHALKDLLHADDSLFAFERVGSDYVANFDGHVKAITARVVEDPRFKKSLNSSVSEGVGRIRSSWSIWVDENEKRIQEIQQRLSQTSEQQLMLREREDRLISRDEFLQHLSGLTGHEPVPEAELDALWPHLEHRLRNLVRQVGDGEPRSLSRAEIATMVHDLVSQELSDLHLETLADDRIRAYWAAMFRSQVNYFSPSAGATIDYKLSSTTYDPTTQMFSPPNLLETHSAPVKPASAQAALEPWQDEGECWCAARSTNRRGNPHGASISVRLAHRIIPQQLVVEHILPGATTDAGSRPRDVEIYADVSDGKIRERIRDFAAAQFPDEGKGDDWNEQPADLPSRFVRIGHFAYESVEKQGGTHVYQLSSELVALGAETDQVIVRAVSNYGARHHTCFYRLRLYGYNAELANAPPLDGIVEAG